MVDLDRRIKERRCSELFRGETGSCFGVPECPELRDMYLMELIYIIKCNYIIIN